MGLQEHFSGYSLSEYLIYLFSLFFFFFPFSFLGLHPRHMQVPRLGVESEL